MKSKRMRWTCVKCALATGKLDALNPRKNARSVVKWSASSRIISEMTTKFYVSRYKTYQVSVYHTDKDCNRLRSDPEQKSHRYITSKELDLCSACDGTIHQNTYNGTKCPICEEDVDKLPPHIRNDH